MPEFTIAEKLEAIEKIKTGLNPTKICKEMKISLSVLKLWQKSEKDLKERLLKNESTEKCSNINKSQMSQKRKIFDDVPQSELKRIKLQTNNDNIKSNNCPEIDFDMVHNDLLMSDSDSESENENENKIDVKSNNISEIDVNKVYNDLLMLDSDSESENEKVKVKEQTKEMGVKSNNFPEIDVNKVHNDLLMSDSDSESENQNQMVKQEINKMTIEKHSEHSYFQCENKSFITNNNDNEIRSNELFGKDSDQKDKPDHLITPKVPMINNETKDEINVANECILFDSFFHSGKNKSIFEDFDKQREINPLMENECMEQDIFSNSLLEMKQVDPKKNTSIFKEFDELMKANNQLEKKNIVEILEMYMVEKKRIENRINSLLPTERFMQSYYERCHDVLLKDIKESRFCRAMHTTEIS